MLLGSSDPTHSIGELQGPLEQANIPTLLLVLTHLTGDKRWLEEPYRPKRPRGLDDNDSGGLSPEIQAQIRTAVIGAVRAYRAGELDVSPPSPTQITEMLSAVMGEAVPSEYGPLMSEEFGFTSRMMPVVRRPAQETFRALVIGAGLSGICAAVQLQAAGIPFSVLDSNPTVGGTWQENTYPGAGVDTPVHLYSFSFAQNPDWSRYFAKRLELFEYIKRVADQYDLWPQMQFDITVTEAVYEAERGLWRVHARAADGTEVVLRANVLISAVGMIARPRMPTIPGLEAFAGPSVHTARWDPDVDVTGKCVGVIGTGASSMQLVPSIADAAQRVICFQRSPQWAIPHPNYLRAVSEGHRLVMAEVPFYASWYRLRALWNFSDRLHPQLQIDPEWPHFDRSINAQNDRQREFLSEYIRKELGERTDLIDACVPDYPPYGKRPLLDNGWFRSLTRDDVELVTGSVAEIRTDRVVMESGDEYPVDILVLATGFKTLEMLGPITFRGRSGRTLRETWGPDDARAYLGITIPDFPNLFCLNGPNTNAGHGGSAVIASEMQMGYAIQLIAYMAEHSVQSVECRQDVHDAYNAELDEALSHKIWTHPGMTTYYRNARGRIVTNSPWTYLEYWRRTRTADLKDFMIEPGPAAEGIPDRPLTRNGFTG